MSALSKLMEARIRLQGSKLSKTGENKFAHYKYFELADFLPTVQSIFYELKLGGYVSFSTDIAVLTIVDLEDGTELKITSPMSTAALKGCHEVQNLGAVETYIRRYLWVTAMEIVEHDALGATTGNETPQKAPVKKAEIKPPAKIEGKEGPWQVKVDFDPDADPKVWVEIVAESIGMSLQAASSRKDVMDIFKVNRNIIDRLKLVNEQEHTSLLSKFKSRKEEFPGEE